MAPHTSMGSTLSLKKLSAILFFSILLILLSGTYVRAQSGSVTESADDAAFQETPAPANTTSCFDYYSFGSVQANLSSEVSGTVSGTAISFSGTLKNNNPYPIVDGALYVKIFKSRGTSNDGNGPDVVDQFLVKGDIVIPAKASVPVKFSWRVPSYAEGGNYQIATFFTTSRKFNLSGLSFTDDVIGNTASFTVSGEATGIVKFDKSSVTIGDAPYFFAAFPPRKDAKSPVTMKATLRNTSRTPEHATLSWTVYQWDGQLRENVVQEESHEITVPAQGSAPVSITVTDSKYPVYYVVGTLSWKDTKSVIGARFVREGVNRTRINFPGVMSFPLKAGEKNTLFSCVHNSGSDASVPGGSLDLTLSDRDGNVIKEYRYDGDITGAMMGVANGFTPTKSYDYFTLSARLYQGSQFVDEANLTYDCAQIDPSLCMPVPEQSFTDFLSSSQSLLTIGGGVIALLFVLLVGARLLRRPSSNKSEFSGM